MCPFIFLLLAMSPHQLTRTLQLLKDVDFMLEQPYPTMNSCDQVCKQVCIYLW